MNCPACYGNTRVLDSRPEDEIVRRRRECMVCKQRFSTVEIDFKMYRQIKNASIASVSSISSIQQKVSETMDKIKNSVDAIILSEVLNHENRNSEN